MTENTEHVVATKCLYHRYTREAFQPITVQPMNLSHHFSQFCTIKLVLFDQENYLWNMKTEKEILKENGLTNIDDFMDVQFGKPGTLERERFREEARTYVNGHAKTAECRNSQKKRK